MVAVNLTEKELELLKKSIKHCLDTCKQGGMRNGCEDCEALEVVYQKLI